MKARFIEDDILAKENNKYKKKVKLQTTMECPNCGAKIDFKNLKEEIKRRIVESIDKACKNI